MSALPSAERPEGKNRRPERGRNEWRVGPFFGELFSNATIWDTAVAQEALQERLFDEKKKDSA